MNRKKLNIKSFWIFFCGIIGYMISQIASAIVTFMQDPATEDILGNPYTEAEMKANQTMNQVGAIMGMVISALIALYFMNRIFKNKKVPQGQKYITVLMVFSIIFIVFGAYSIIARDVIGILFIFVDIAILVACILQKKYMPSFEEAGMYGAPPYGNPYGNPNPYGAPNGYPYANQNPYGTPPSGNPYANQNPYGTPPSGNPYPNQNPYGTPPSGNPYANQNPYGTPPSGNPYANQNPYGTPPNGNPYSNQNPYGTPPSGNPYPNQNPYGTPPSSDPYANQPNQNPYDPNNNNNEN